MLYQIPSFLLDVIVGLLGGACLLRLYMQYHRVPFGNPLGRFIFAVTDWIVMPLRRIVPSYKRWDIASPIAAWLLVMVKFLLLWLLIGNLSKITVLPLISLIGLAQLAVSGLTALLVVYAVLSWVPGANAMLLDLIARLAEPLVRPLRRFIPLIGGVDLSPLVAIVLLVMVKFLLLWLLIGNLGKITVLPLISLIGLAQLAVSGLTALLVVYAVLSWVPGANAMLLDLIARLAEPLVRPLRRFIPLIGGVDLSPLVAIVLLQVAAILLGNAMGWAWTLGR